MKKNVLWSLALGASLTVSGAAVLHGCGSGISPVELTTEDTINKITAISPSNGHAIGGFTLTLSGTDFGEVTAVTVGGSDCALLSGSTSSTVTCTTPAMAAGTYDVVLTESNGQVSTLPNALEYKATVVFSRDLQSLFDEPLTNGTSTNNSACIYCHSPAVPLTSIPVSSTTNCNTSSSSDCQGRGDLNKIQPSLLSAAQGQALTHYNGTAFATGTTFPKGDFVESAAASSWSSSGLVASKLAFSNSFNKSQTGYSFDCNVVKYTLKMNSSGLPLTSVSDLTNETDVNNFTELSKLYLKVKDGGNMPLTGASGANAATDMANNAVKFNSYQLRLLKRWAFEGYDCVTQ